METAGRRPARPHPFRPRCPSEAFDPAHRSPRLRRTVHRHRLRRVPRRPPPPPRRPRPCRLRGRRRRGPHPPQGRGPDGPLAPPPPRSAGRGRLHHPRHPRRGRGAALTDTADRWARVETTLALLAIDPAGLGGLWLRARAAPLRDRVTDAIAASLG